MRNEYKILLRNLKGREHLTELGVDLRIIFEWIIETFPVW